MENYNIVLKLHLSLYCVIVRVRVVLKRTVVDE